MGQVKSCTQDVRERGCWSAVTYPKVAPEWYRKLVSGVGSGDIHLKAAPPGSLFLLGHISLAVPDLYEVTDYWVGKGVGAGRSIHEHQGGELRANIGPCQMRFPLVPGKEPQSWPGEIKIWVEDIRATTDSFNALGNAYGMTDIVQDMPKAKTGGEFALKLWDFNKKNTFVLTECPAGWASKLRSIPHDPSEGDSEYPPKVFNPICISDALVFINSRDTQEGIVRFYQHFLILPPTTLRQPGPSEYSTTIHFQAAEGLHQTLTFLQDPKCPPYSNIGSICIYIRDRGTFVRCFARCKVGGILKEEKPRTEVEREQEFTITGIIDPTSKRVLVPLEHCIRYAMHPDCPVSPDFRSSASSKGRL